MSFSEEQDTSIYVFNKAQVIANYENDHANNDKDAKGVLIILVQLTPNDASGEIWAIRTSRAVRALTPADILARSETMVHNEAADVPGFGMLQGWRAGDARGPSCFICAASDARDANVSAESC